MKILVVPPKLCLAEFGLIFLNLYGKTCAQIMGIWGNLAIPRPDTISEAQPKRLMGTFLAALILIPVLVLGQDGPWVITTDYGVFGRVESFAQSVPWETSGNLTVIPGDAVGRYHDGLVYIVGRGGSNLVRIHDPAQGFALVREFSLGAGKNPQDIAFDAQGRAFVSCYDEAVLLVVDTQTGTVQQSISTAFYADADGLPETSWLLIHENRLYLTCQKLDRGNWYAPTGPGQLLVLDLETLQWLAPVDLVGANPYTKIYLETPNRLLVGCVGYWALLDGGIEVVNLSTQQSEGYLISEENLGGDILQFVITGPNQLHALTSNPSFVTRISRVDTYSGSVVPIVTSSGYDLADLAWDHDFQIYVADRKTSAAGIRVFDSGSGAELTSQPVSTGLPPFQFVIPVQGGISPVIQIPGFRGNLALGQPRPNPCNPRSDLIIQAEADQTVSVSVFDLRGHLVNKTRLLTDSTGLTEYRFTGHDTQGFALAAGLYRVVAQSPGGFAAQTLTLVK